MKIDAGRIRAEREKRAWSQEHLAEVAGLGLRTIQRIESSGTASYESVKAIASALDMTSGEFRVEAPLPATGGQNTDQGGVNKNAVNTVNKKWNQPPAWVRFIFLGSSVAKMDRRQLKKLEKVEVATASLLMVAWLLSIFGIVFPDTASAGLLFMSMLFYALAYLSSIHITIGDRYTLWGNLAPVNRAVSRFTLILLIVALSFPIWAFLAVSST